MKILHLLLITSILMGTQAYAQSISQPTKVIHSTAVESKPVKKGHCWVESIVSSRKDAWRCMIGNDIYDPCFAVPSKPIVICGMSPAENKTGFAVKLTQPLPKISSSQGRISRPFQVRLRDGSICTPFTGTLTQVGKEVIEYGCQNKACTNPESCQVGILSIHTKQPLWMAKVVIYTISKEGKLEVKAFQQVPVETAWE